jgi:hypothetical protein
MIEIGTSLREARERRGLELSDVERDIRVRAKQLRALEAERFDELPARVYARAFLREYADYLGLDADQFLAEFDERFPAVEEEPFAPVGLPRPWRVPRHLAAALVALVAVAGLGVLGWRGRSESPATTEPPALRTDAVTTEARSPRPKRTHARAAAALSLVAARGPCWLEVHERSREGPLLYRGTLEVGQRLRFPARALWMRIGAPWNLDARLNRKAVTLPERVANVLVTRTGVHPVPR